MKKTFYMLVACYIVCSFIALRGNAQTIYTFCGGPYGYSGDGGPATAATMARPSAIKIHNGDMYFADSDNDCVRSITGSGYIINTVAGNGTYGYTGDGGSATAATITGAGDIVFDNSNNMFFCDIYNHAIRKVNTSGVISTVAGDGSNGSIGDGGPATAARFYTPIGLEIDAAGHLYVADHRNHKIRKIDASTGIITTIAGTGTSGSSGDGGAATAADIQYPVGVALDAAGNIYFSEYGHGTIRKIDAVTGIISTFATGMTEPMYIQFDQAGNLFVGSEDSPGRVYKVSPTGTVGIVAGNGLHSTPTGDGGPATAAGMSRSEGVAIGRNGNLYISDRNNDRIRVVIADAATISGTSSICVGATTSLAASIPGAVWVSGNASIATISSSGVVTGVAAGTATITYVAGLVFGTKVVTVNVAVAPTITASGSTLSVPASFASYQWSLGGTPIPGATNATYAATTDGSYVVLVTTSDGCSITSASYTYMSTVSVGGVSKAAGLLISPNPASNGRFTLSLPSAGSDEMTIAVTNAVGETVYETTSLTNIPVSVNINVPSGIYIVQVVSGGMNYHSRILVN